MDMETMESRGQSCHFSFDLDNIILIMKNNKRFRLYHILMYNKIGRYQCTMLHKQYLFTSCVNCKVPFTVSPNKTQTADIFKMKSWQVTQLNVERKRERRTSK